MRHAYNNEHEQSEDSQTVITTTEHEGLSYARENTAHSQMHFTVVCTHQAARCMCPMQCPKRMVNASFPIPTLHGIAHELRIRCSKTRGTNIKIRHAERQVWLICTTPILHHICSSPLVLLRGVLL